MSNMYRQGDILFIERGGMTLDVSQPVADDVVMHGQLTGHNHVVRKGKFYRAPEKIPERWESRSLVIGHIVAEKGCSIVHDEHKVLKLPEGHYEVRRQQEVSGYVQD